MSPGLRAHVSSLLLGCLFAFGCGLGSEEPGSFAVTFRWKDQPPIAEAWVQARVEQGDGDARLEVAETPFEQVSEKLTLRFASVRHGGPYRVVVEVKGAPDKQARTLYFGESAPFTLRPGRRTEVEVALALTAAPSAADDVGDPAGVVVVVEENERGYVRDARVTLSLSPRGATRVIAANDFALSQGRKELSLASLPEDGARYLLEWDLEQDLCARPPCPDGTRYVFAQFLNERGYASQVVSAQVELDRGAPEVVGASLEPAHARVDAAVRLRVTSSEPLAEPPRLSVSPRDPGFGPFVQLAGGGYVAEYRASRSEEAREEFGFAVQLTDRAGNRRALDLEQRLLVDAQAPGLSWGAYVVPSVVRDGERYSLSFELDEVVPELPVVRVGSTAVGCTFAGPTRRLVECAHVADRSEGNGERTISIEVRDLAGNAVTLLAGAVLYDTLSRCGDGVLVEEQLEVCDEGLANSNAPDAKCRLDCRPRRCGDGVFDPLHGEVCDDGNDDAGDGCASDCRSKETCANGILDVVAGEACDDGNLLSHDGCSSACQKEGLLLDDASVLPNEYLRGTYDPRRNRVLAYSRGSLFELGELGFREVSRVEASTGPIAYDAARNRVVLYDGIALWEWDGVRWETQVGPDPQRPSDREYAALTYVGSRAHSLLFGGEIHDEGTTSEMWSWDGRLWDEVSTGEGPSARALASIAYDPRRDRVVLFGGVAFDADDMERNDTWEWDGARWHALEVDDGPPASFVSALAYDLQRDRMVLAGDATDHLWELNGASWQKLPPAIEGGFDEPQLIYDARRRRMVVFTGEEGAVWAFDGSAWAPLHEADERPDPVLGQAVVYESAHARGLAFGGYLPPESNFQNGEVELYGDDTWVWLGSSWTALSLDGEPPPARAFAAMAHDPLRGVTLLFGGEVGVDQPCAGGCAQVAALSDTWELSGNQWRRVGLAGPNPPNSAGAQMFFDLARRRITLFTATDEGTLSVWHWDGSRWTEQPLTGDLPHARRHFTVAYDAERERAVLYGGQAEEGAGPVALDDTWEWDGTQFHALHPEVSPGARTGHAMIFHGTRGRVMLYGGSQDGESTQDAWEWDGKTWTELAVRHTQGPFTFSLRGHSMFFDEKSHAALCVGGRAKRGNFERPQWGTSALRFEVNLLAGCASSNPAGSCPGPALEETCQSDHDGDADGLIGCADPDCYGRCSPSCNPLRMSCDEALPHCGDGECTAAEDCSLCPGDCGACPALCGDYRCDAGEDPLSCPGDCAP